MQALSVRQWLQEMPMYKIVFSDIDGTLLKSDGTVDDKLKTKIQALVNGGVPFVLASARSGVGVLPILKMLDIKAPIIAFSGALIYDKDKNVIKSLEMPKEDAVKIHNYILSKNPDISVCTYALDLWLCDKKDSWVINEEKAVGLESVKDSILNYPEISGVHKLLCMGTKEEIDHIYDCLIEEYGEFDICRSKETYLEVNIKGSSKFLGMKFICDSMGIDLNDTVAFGDSDVDLEMINNAGMGYIMGNAPDNLKAMAKHIARSNDESGIYHILKELDL